MRSHFVSLMSAFAAGLVVPAHGEPANSPRSVVSAASLRADLLQLSAAMLLPSRLQLDEGQARVTTSRDIASNDEFVALPLWQAGAAVPSMPLVFDLLPAHTSRDAPAAAPIRAFVAAPLQRDVLVAQRKTERGSALTCADLAAERKPARFVPPQAIQPPCSLPPDLVLRRSLVAGEPLRQGDVGALPDVTARGPVSVRVVIGQVALEKAGTALADAQLGDTVRVRLNGSSQQLSGRVVAHQVVVVEGSE